MRMLELGIEFTIAALRTAGRSSGSVIRNLVWVTRKWWESSRGVYAGLEDAWTPPMPMTARPRSGYRMSLKEWRHTQSPGRTPRV